MVALKLLVIWRDDVRRGERVEMSRRFVELAARHGLLSVLEPVVRVPDDEREDAIVEAARELGDVRPSLYKCQVPLYGRGDPAELERRAPAPSTRRCRARGSSSRRASSRTTSRRAVEAACRGGASGFLAGRALWTATLGADDPTELLRGLSSRAAGARRIVDAHGRPWREEPFA